MLLGRSGPRQRILGLPRTCFSSSGAAGALYHTDMTQPVIRVSVAFIASFGFLFASHGSPAETPLDQYVRAADPAYRYELAVNRSDDEATLYSIKLTSQ